MNEQKNLLLAIVVSLIILLIFQYLFPNEKKVTESNNQNIINEVEEFQNPSSISRIDAIKNQTTNDFIHFYQMIDVLIIDDVQFFSGKEKTQDVFFHVFNHLHQNGKQIILTSDKPPVEMQGMEQRLLSRFKWGLSADLSAPDLETRMAILEKKMYGNGIDLPKDVVEYLAYSINTNVRDGGCFKYTSSSSLIE